MMYDDYLSFGGVEIANSARAKAYAESASCPVYWIKTEACENLPVALNHLPYNSETVYDSPWYDPANHDLSTRFFGVVVVSVKGLSDSSREISTIEGIKDGGVISGQRRGSRRARYRLALIARGADALEYGINWLSSKLDGQKCGQHGTRCGTSDLQFFADCPPPMEFDYTFDPDPSRTVRNLFTNPNLVGTGTYATVAENLFTNPRLKGNGTWAEVRRNHYITNPGAHPDSVNPGLYGWASGGVSGEYVNAPWSETGSAYRYTQTTAAYFGVGSTTIAGIRNRIGAGEITVAFTVMPLEDGYTGGGSMEWRSPTGIVDTVYPRPPMTAGVPVRLWATFDESFSDHLAFYPTLPQGASIEFSEFDAYPGPYQPGREWFDGSTTPATAEGIIQPEDFRWRWLGAPNASESVMEIERVRGITVSECIAGVSSKDGKPAIRQIGIGAGNQALIMGVPAGARAGGVALATKHQEEVFTRTGNTYNIAVINPQQGTPRTNRIGAVANRREFTTLSSGYQLYLNSGTNIIGSEVWWTDIGLFAGNYPYEAFNGESDPVDTGVTQPEDFRIRWSGEVDNSTSVMEIERVRGLTGYNAIAGVSSVDGRPAVRVIGTAEATQFVLASMPVDARSGGVALAKVRTLEDITSGIGRRGPYVREPARITTHPIESGDYSFRLEFPVMTSAYEFRLYGSGSVGSRDKWYMDIGIFAGDYQGEWFTGDFPSTPAPLDNPVIYSWEGERNNSVSRREQGEWILTENPERHRLLVNEVTRFMHDVAVSSGPLLIEEYEKGGVNAAIVEVNFQSERGYIYGAPRELNLDAAELSSVNDVGINLIPNPRGRLKSTTNSTIARNAVSNPSFETNLTGWSATVGTISRSFQELRARGDYSLKIATTGLNARASHTIAAASRSSASRAVLGVWVALTSSGAKVPSAIELEARSGSTIYGSRTITTPTANSGQYYTLEVEGVPSSGNVEIVVDAHWTGGTSQNVSMYLDTVMFLQDG